jgi:hypothetical protein
MKPAELLLLIESELHKGARAGNLPERLRSEGVDYTFSKGFTDKVISKISEGVVIMNRQIDFARSLNSIFYRVAFAGVAAIIVLLISIFFSEGSLSFNSLVGISRDLDENLVGLLTIN